MIELRTRAVLAGGLVALALFMSRVPAGADAIQILSLQTGHSIILNADGLNRVAVGDGRIAGVVPIGTAQVVVNGKAPGHTTIFVWSSEGRTTYEVTVTEQSFDDIAKVLRAAINVPSVQVVAFDVNLIVRGSVPDAAEYQRLQGVLDRFKGIKFSSSSGGGNGVIINAVTVEKPLGNLQDEIAGIPGGHDLRVDADDKGNIIVSGTVRDTSEAEEVLDKVRGLAGPYLSADGKVIDRLGTDQASEVDVKVYVLEVDNTAQKDLGLSLQSAQPGTINGATPNGPYTISSSPTIVALGGTTAGNPFALGAFSRISLLAPTLSLLVQEGHAKILSSPNLVTEPGLEATFLVGGEIPIPVSNGLGTVSITYKEYGVKLNVTPTILGSGGVETKVAPEVSQLDFADGVTLNGYTVPAFKTSKLATDVITSNGESIVLGGLLSRVESRNVTKFPILGDIPILGELFRSTSYQHNDSDVVFVMTPTIVTK